MNQTYETNTMQKLLFSTKTVQYKQKAHSEAYCAGAVETLQI
jgi:hypothetical protein